MNKHPTKSGPGRMHGEGVSRAPIHPKVRGNAGFGFEQHHTFASRSARRALVKLHGIRQAKRILRARARAET